MFPNRGINMEEKHGFKVAALMALCAVAQAQGEVSHQAEKSYQEKVAQDTKTFEALNMKMFECVQMMNRFETCKGQECINNTSGLKSCGQEVRTIVDAINTYKFNEGHYVEEFEIAQSAAQRQFFNMGKNGDECRKNIDREVIDPQALDDVYTEIIDFLKGIRDSTDIIGAKMSGDQWEKEHSILRKLKAWLFSRQ